MKIPAKGELHGRAIEEWVGKTPATPVPDHVVLRIMLRQERKCAISGARLGKRGTYHADHKIRLKDGGENRESNLQVILVEPHKIKSAHERRIGKKVTRLQKKDLGIWKPKSRPMDGTRASGLKKKMSGEVVRREA